MNFIRSLLSHAQNENQLTETQLMIGLISFNKSQLVLPTKGIILFILICLVSLGSAMAKPGQGVVLVLPELETFNGRFWISGNQDQIHELDLTQVEFTSRRSELNQRGYRIGDLEIHTDEGRLLLSAIWEPGTGREQYFIGLAWAEFEEAWLTKTAQGLILKDIESYVEDEVRYFAGVWGEDLGEQQALMGPSSATNFMSSSQILLNQGFQLTDLEAFDAKGKSKFIALWDKKSGTSLYLYDMSWNEFHEEFHNLHKDNYRLTDFESYLINGRARYLGIWHPSTREDLLVILDKSWNLDSFPNAIQLSGFALLDFERFKEDPETRSPHDPPAPIGLSTKVGGVIAPGGDDDPDGMLMPLHNGGSTGPGN